MMRVLVFDNILGFELAVKKNIFIDIQYKNIFRKILPCSFHLYGYINDYRNGTEIAL